MGRLIYMTKQQERVYRVFLYLLLGVAVCTLATVVYVAYWDKIPSTIKIRAGVEQELNFKVPVSGEIYRVEENAAQVSSLPESMATEKEAQIAESISDSVKSIHVDFAHPVKVKANEIDTYQMDLKLFGVLPYKNVDIEVIQDKMLIPSGIPIGIYVKTNGVLVVGIGEFEDGDGGKVSPAKYILQKGDYILRADGEEIENKKQLIRLIEETKHNDTLTEAQKQDEISLHMLGYVKSCTNEIIIEVLAEILGLAD